jgi:hypothetical protein
MRSITTFDVLVEGLQLLRNIVIKLAKGNKVDGHLVLPHLLRQLDQALLIFGDRAAGEDYDALTLGLVLSMFEGELCAVQLALRQVQ